MLMIPPEEEDAEDNEVGYQDNYVRIKEILNTLTTQVRIFDKKAEIISWKASMDFSFLLIKGTFPDDVANIAKFFKG